MSRVLKNYPHIITSAYGKRGSSWHGGVDVTGYRNKTHVLDYITAHSDGKVIATRNDITGFIDGGSYGNYVIIDHGSGYKTLYAHMAYKSVAVKVGDKVKAGTVIGYMGNTGTSYGGHLHFEVRLNDERINPTEYLDKELPINKGDDPKPQPTKSIDEVARDVINGDYGNYPERKERLEAEGYNYAEVQARVNEILKPTPAPSNIIKEGDTVIVNGEGRASSNGKGATTRTFKNTKMKVIAIAKNASHPYALNQYNEGKVGDYSKVTAWFAPYSIKK